MADQLLRQNRFGQQPKWEQLGIDVPRFPLHIKNVTPINYGALEAIDVQDESLREKWRRAKRWITEPQAGIPRTSCTEAAFTEEEHKLFQSCGQSVPTEAKRVRATVNIFFRPEQAKERSRVIKHTKAFNDAFGRETLLGTTLLNTKQNTRAVHHGEWAVTLDMSAWFDQFALGEDVSPDFCYMFKGKWHELKRLPMGMRQAVDIAHTAMEILTSFKTGPSVLAFSTSSASSPSSLSSSPSSSVRKDKYIDNVRFLGTREEVIDAAATFIARCRVVGAQINEVGPDEDARAAAERLVHQQGEFLGVDFDYAKGGKTVKLGGKTVAKLQIMSDAFSKDGFTHHNYLALHGLLFYELQVKRAYPATRFHAIKEYAEISRRIQRDPGLMFTKYKCSPSIREKIQQWIDYALANEAVPVPVDADICVADFFLITDASSWGWGAILYDTRSGRMRTWNDRWGAHFYGAEKSAWSEPEAISLALRHFFPHGTEDRVAVLSDSQTSVGAYRKGRSKCYAVNRALLEVEKVFPFFNASWYHIPGDANPTDPLSRGLDLGLTEVEATAVIRRLKDGLTREKGRGVPMVVFTKVEAKDIGDNLCGKDIKISNAHPPTEVLGTNTVVGVGKKRE